MPPTLIAQPTRVAAAGNKPKLIDEYIGRMNSKTAGVSVAHMRSPQGWVEPGQTPEFEEFTIVLKGVLRVSHKDGEFDVKAGQAVVTHPGEWVRYSTPDVGAQNFGYHHASVLLLIVLDNRNPCAADRESAAVERVHELAFLRAFRAIANIGASRLESLEVGAGRDLAEQTLPREPHFDVVGFSRGKPHITGGENDGAVVQPELLKNFFRISG